MLVALVSVSAFAQFRVQGALSVGGYKDNDNFNIAPGLAARVLYEYNLGAVGSNEVYYISAGAGFVQNNTTLKSDSDTKVNVNWIQIPVMIGSDYSLARGTIYTAVGLYYGYALSGKGENGSLSMDFVSEDSAFRLFNRHDFGWVVQAGFSLPCNLGIYAGFNGGFLDICCEEGTSARNDILEVGLMFKF